MLRPAPQNRKSLKCDICGKPAIWRNREFHARYVLGDALCAECDEAIYGRLRIDPKSSDNKLHS